MIALFRQKTLISRSLLSLLHHDHLQNTNFLSQNPKNLPLSTSKFPEYELPSVTWGAIHGRKERLVSRIIISDYLKSLGIVPDDLAPIELPSTIDVMRERVEFLQKLGLTIDDINSYPFMLGCSLRKNVIPVLTYLQKIGFPKSKLGEFVKNYPQCLHASVIVELAPVVRFLRGLDVEKQDLPYVLSRYPELFGFKLEGTMSTSVAYLVSIGVSPRDIGPMVTQFPYFLGMRVGTVIKPMVDYLIWLGIPKMILARMVEKRTYILGYDLEETVKPNVDALISFGVRKEAIPIIVAQFPQILGLPLKAKLSTMQYFFSLKVKIDPEGFVKVLERLPQIVSLNQNLMMRPVEFLRGRGFSDGDVARMVVKCPQLLVLRVEVMKNSFYFFKSEIRRGVEELLEFPEYFTYSLESRIKPRYHRLASKGIRCGLSWFLNCSDQRFEGRLEGSYIEGESTGPSFVMGGKLEMPGSELVSEEEEDDSDEASLFGVEPLMQKIQSEIRRVDAGILAAVRQQSNSGTKAKEDLAAATHAVQELTHKILEIKTKAEQSETVVQEICPDIKKLDFAKKHITTTITALYHLTMLVSAVDQLQVMASKRQYKETAAQLEAVNQLCSHFEAYRDVPKINELREKYKNIKKILKSRVFSDFSSLGTGKETEESNLLRQLPDVCLVVDALELSVREDLVNFFLQQGAHILSTNF